MCDCFNLLLTARHFELQRYHMKRYSIIMIIIIVVVVAVVTNGYDLHIYSFKLTDDKSDFFFFFNYVNWFPLQNYFLYVHFAFRLTKQKAVVTTIINFIGIWLVTTKWQSALHMI